MNIYHEIDVTHLNDLPKLMSWCEQQFVGDWNIVSDSGSAACRGGGSHTVTLLCVSVEDWMTFNLSWSDCVPVG